MSDVKYKLSGRGDILYKYLNIMRNDEHLLRLLYYNPIDKNGNYVEFTDSNLPNVLDFEEQKLDEIRSDLIRTSQKSDDIIETKKTVVFVYFGKSKAKFHNRLLVDREIVFHILSHNDFSFASRIEEICDRLDTLFSGKRIGGIGLTEIANSFPREAPKEYLAYEQKYTITDKRA